MSFLRVLRGDGDAADGAARPSLLSIPETEWPSPDEIDAIFDRYEAAVLEVQRASARLEATLERISRGAA